MGQEEDEEHVKMAKDSWLERRKYRHGWKENKSNEPKERGVNMKNNKTKAIEKKYKKRLIGKAQRGKTQGREMGRDSKPSRGGSSSRGGGRAGRGAGKPSRGGKPGRGGKSRGGKR